MVTLSQSRSVALAAGPLRLTITGEGAFALQSSTQPGDSMTSPLREDGPQVVFRQGPAVLTVTPAAGHGLGVAVCTP